MKILIVFLLLPFAAEAAPIGHLVFCLQNSQTIDCQPQLGLPVGSYADLKAVKYQVDQRYSESLDRGETWELLSNSHRSGDCEDYAMTYRHLLLLAGWPSSSLRIAVGKKSGQGHAILVAQAQEGWFVLDILERKPIALDRYVFNWDEIQTENNPKKWEDIP